MKSIYPALLMAGVFVLFSSVHARAEIRAESFGVNPFVGCNFFENDQNLKTSSLFGGRVGYNFSKHFGIESAVEFIETRVDDKTRTDLTQAQFGSSTDGANLIFYHIDAVYHFMPDSKFTPFVVVGLDGAHYSPRILDKGMAAFNVGAGVKYAMTDNIGLMVDVRDYMVTEVMQDTYHNVGAMAGITFAFGGTEKLVPVAQEKIVSSPGEPRGLVIDFDDIHFDFDRAALKPEAKKILSK
ncbi:MAG: outer membrane beta-barrel domain-containing protein [Deltaproteobacteria bacterium]|nr:outer membrane beta-barrel domain-containing protein [Deltaproteobacteria bacterium]